MSFRRTKVTYLTVACSIVVQGIRRTRGNGASLGCKKVGAIFVDVIAEMNDEVVSVLPSRVAVDIEVSRDWYLLVLRRTRYNYITHSMHCTRTQPS